MCYIISYFAFSSQLVTGSSATFLKISGLSKEKKKITLLTLNAEVSTLQTLKDGKSKAANEGNQ